MKDDFIAEQNSTELSIGNESSIPETILFSSKNYDVVLTASSDTHPINLLSVPSDEAYQVRNRNTKVIEIRANQYPAALEIVLKLEQATKMWLHELEQLSINIKESQSASRGDNVTPISKKAH